MNLENKEYKILLSDFIDIFGSGIKYNITNLINEYAYNNHNEIIYKTYSLNLLGKDWIYLYENKNKIYKSIEFKIIKNDEYEKNLNIINNETKLKYIYKLELNDYNIINNEHNNIVYFKDDKLDNFINSYDEYINKIKEKCDDVLYNKNIENYINSDIDYNMIDWNRNYDIDCEKDILYNTDFIHDDYLENIIYEFYDDWKDNKELANYCCKYIISIVLYKLRYEYGSQTKIFRLKLKSYYLALDIIDEYNSWDTKLFNKLNNIYIDIIYNKDISYFINGHKRNYNVIEVNYYEY